MWVWVWLLKVFRGTSDRHCGNELWFEGIEEKVMSKILLGVNSKMRARRYCRLCMAFCFKNWTLLACDLHVLRKFESENGLEKKGCSAEVLQLCPREAFNGCLVYSYLDFFHLGCAILDVFV